MKKKSIHFQLTEKEVNSLKDRAWEERLSLSDYIRYCLMKDGVQIEELIKDRNN